MNNNDPLYPIRLYIYDENGQYGEPVLINNESQLQHMGVKLIIKTAMELGREVRMADPNDFLLFHSKDGKILFDGANSKPLDFIVEVPLDTGIWIGIWKCTAISEREAIRLAKAEFGDLHTQYRAKALPEDASRVTPDGR